MFVEGSEIELILFNGGLIDSPESTSTLLLSMEVSNLNSESIKNHLFR
jgi:hypothetical protein